MYDYKSAGVDTKKAQGYIQDLKGAIQDTHRGLSHGKVIDNFGGFAGIFETQGVRLVAATDGVGTKIHLARQFAHMGALETLGQDLVAMCVNDLYCVGAQPLFFLDYIACGKLDESWYHPVLSGIAAACKTTGMALLGGESAEHPGVMQAGDFDLAGFCVGSLQRDEPLPDMARIREGDLLYGAPSSGLHSNGFSLVRKILGDLETTDPEKYKQLASDARWVKEVLLAPTAVYTGIPAMLKEVDAKALAHITGGGFYENIERVMPPGLSVSIDSGLHAVVQGKPPKTPLPEIYDFLAGFVAPRDLYSTFNMGVGMVCIASAEHSASLEKQGFFAMGRVEKREAGAVRIKGIDY